ncbi:MAG: c-type cytochrome [Planctomycetes bacterium]|nr:c-type cytochrome [Planctomycetota bacterium]
MVIVTVIGCLLVALVSDSFRSYADADEKPEHKLPAGPLGETIKLGEALVEQTVTHPLTKEFVGNSLNCTSCHLKNGTDPMAATLLGVATAYPAWSPRENRVITLEDRVLNCFMRSCNGVRPPLGSKPSVAITAYITWLSSGQPVKLNGKAPQGPNAVPTLAIKADKADLVRGEKLYAAKCASCHAMGGEGRKENPPVWGAKSFNQGAGLANADKLAAWLKVAMPLDDPDLTEQAAVDVAAFVDSKPRPEFVLKDHLPKEGKLGEYNAEPKR